MPPGIGYKGGKQYTAADEQEDAASVQIRQLMRDLMLERLDASAQREAALGDRRPPQGRRRARAQAAPPPAPAPTPPQATPPPRVLELLREARDQGTAVPGFGINWLTDDSGGTRRWTIDDLPEPNTTEYQPGFGARPGMVFSEEEVATQPPPLTVPEREDQPTSRMTPAQRSGELRARGERRQLINSAHATNLRQMAEQRRRSRGPYIDHVTLTPPTIDMEPEVVEGAPRGLLSIAGPGTGRNSSLRDFSDLATPGRMSNRWIREGVRELQEMTPEDRAAEIQRRRARRQSTGIQRSISEMMNRGSY
jgi:hypothetical protein